MPERDQHIVRLHVAVDEPRGVQRDEPLRDLAPRVTAELLGQPADVQDRRADYHAPSALLARERTLALFHANGG